MPRWADIEPSEIPLLLPNVVVVHVRVDPLDFIDRIIGQTVRDHAARKTVNTLWSEIPGRGPESTIWNVFQTVVESQSPQFRSLQNVGRTKEFVSIESVLCPISDDGKIVNKVLGFIEFSTTPLNREPVDWTQD